MFTIPNILTGLNVLFGCIGAIMVMEGKFSMAISCVGFCLLFDFLDGFIARLIHQNSALGVQLDSLADVISFGLVPGLMVFKLIQSISPDMPEFFAMAGLILPVAAAFRLARFNVEATGESKDFRGLPVPAMAIFISGIYAMIFIEEWKPDFIINIAFFVVVIIGMSVLMLSRAPVIKVNIHIDFIKKHIFLCTIYAICLFLLFFKIYHALSIAVLVHLLYSSLFQKTLKN